MLSEHGLEVSCQVDGFAPATAGALALFLAESVVWEQGGQGKQVGVCDGGCYCVRVLGVGQHSTRECTYRFGPHLSWHNAIIHPTCFQGVDNAEGPVGPSHF